MDDHNALQDLQAWPPTEVVGLPDLAEVQPLFIFISSNIALYIWLDRACLKPP